ncbi:UTRA domain-containing protein [Gloeocapsopsis crepidinum LEGE 06123]|uniref:UTRA domain-containing protein n=1 Tax=Gloeocapsopsis crepidinum LEGE 06123 TaxID=588587 RepID=A0ABR9UWQ8_9CHRO|nr:UTRA domain-containing protein [Gloeocapsopsis crepidinum]MBE9192739.1 UTRA domain-containing protein [Gloeocapsopsis crepidinum LEGE 06123]
MVNECATTTHYKRRESPEVIKHYKRIAISADSKVAPKLDLEPGDPVALIEMLDLADNQPLSVSSSYFPLHRFPDIIEQFQDTQSISKLVREVYGCDHSSQCRSAWQSDRVHSHPISRRSDGVSH